MTLTQSPTPANSSIILPTVMKGEIIPIQRNFNGGLFALRDPLDDAGVDLDMFDTALTYAVKREQHTKIG